MHKNTFNISTVCVMFLCTSSVIADTTPQLNIININIVPIAVLISTNV